MDAVPGRNATKATKSAHETTYCQPCFEDGKTLPPEAFCPVCNEFLCSTCARVHRNMKLTRNHPLQDKSSMPSSFRADSADKHFTETCKLHVEKFIEYYCPHHEDLLCGYCVVGNEEHRSCNVEKIYQVAKRYKEASEYTCLMAGLGKIVNDIENYSSNIHASMNSVDEESLTNINELRKFRNEINQYLDKREKELLEEIDQKKRNSSSLLNELKSKCKNVKQATEKLSSELQAQEANSNQLFIVGKRAVKELTGLQKALDDVDRLSKVPQYTLLRDPAIEHLLASNTAIGKLEEKESTSALEQQQHKPETMQQQRQQKTKQQQLLHAQALMQIRADLSQSQFKRRPGIPMKTSEDTNDCFLTSLAFLPGDRFLLVDCNNTSVKLVDTKSNKVVSQLKLSSSPWDLCLLPGDKAAVLCLLRETYSLYQLRTKSHYRALLRWVYNAME
ncbi:protein wech-like [Mya arenaria]|uniref:protein wech-like n=1 Tax=Mya arenaria TaxID=6604 RepID=UPI0022E2CEF8|nr:protein wech-like [Mya arenaria]